MDSTTFRNISKIIERESKTTTYKFALLRGVIDIIGSNSPYIRLDSQQAVLPLGLMIERWLLYYYPIFDTLEQIPQIAGAGKLAFQNELIQLIAYYKERGGLSAFYNEMRSKGISPEIAPLFQELTKKLGGTITRMPMKYIGSSINDGFYSIFKYSKGRMQRTEHCDLAWLIQSFGAFSIPIDYYEAFRLLGSFIAGNDAILFQWADFSVAASGQSLNVEKVVAHILKNPVTERDVLDTRKQYQSMLQNMGAVNCVWSGKQLGKYDIDHMLPFAVWKNNDLWNLLPAAPAINNQKRHKIPTSVFLEQRRENILYYWNALHDLRKDRFLAEIKIALLGSTITGNWQEQAFAQLKNTSDYLINIRGHQPWAL